MHYLCRVYYYLLRLIYDMRQACSTSPAGRSSVGTPSKKRIQYWKNEHLAKYQSSRGDEGHRHPEFAVLRNALDTTELTVI